MGTSQSSSPAVKRFACLAPFWYFVSSTPVWVTESDKAEKQSQPSQLDLNSAT